MSHTDRLKRSPNAFRQLTGLTPDAFDQLLTELAPRYDQAELQRKTRRPRLRKPGAGPKRKLILADRLLMLLIYYRTYTTHVFLGFLFGIDDSAVCRNINPLQPLLAGIFRIPERKVTIEPDEIRTLFFDATEQAIPRPTRRQKRFYSGKKKRHTVKHQIVVVRKRKKPGQRRRVRIAAVSGLFPGSVHDKKVYDQTQVVVPPGVKRMGDTAYLGTPLVTPTRKPRKGTLTAKQKTRNRRISTCRIAAEHGIGKMKIWRIASDRYRNPRGDHTLMMKNIAGLHNRMFA